MDMLTGAEDEVSANIFAAVPSILWQRRWLLLPPVILLTAGGIAAAYMLPPQYQSSATVLIESAQLKDGNLLGASAVDVIQQRIARARERVMSRQDLIRSIRTNNLYPSEQQSVPLSAIVDKMRGDTSVQAVNVDGAGGAIAMRVSFTYSDPAKAQIVTQQFVNRFLELDAATAAEQAKGAERFLRDEMSTLQNQLDAVETQIKRFKEQNGVTLVLGSRGTGDPAADIARIDGEIAVAEAQRRTVMATNVNGDTQVAQLQGQLNDLQAKFSDTHPDVLALKARLEAAKRNAAPAAVNSGALDVSAAQISAMRQARALLLSSSASSRSAAAQAPAIMAESDALEKQADQLRDRQRTLGQSLQQAQITARLESEQKGERLTLADPPLVPDHPSWPNRPMVIAAAAATGLGLGCALIMLIELIMRPIRGVDALRSVTGVAPLALVPDFGRRPHFLIRWLERRNRRRASQSS